MKKNIYFSILSIAMMLMLALTNVVALADESEDILPDEPQDEIELTDFDRAINVAGGMLHFENDEEYPWEIVEEDGRTAVRVSVDASGSDMPAVYWNAGTLPKGALIKFSWKIVADGKCMGNFCSELSCYNYLLDADGWHDATYTIMYEDDYVFHWYIQNNESVEGTNTLYLDDVSITMHYTPDVLLGDLNGNDMLDAADATLLLRHIVGIDPLSEEVLETIADANEDGVVNSGDAAFILKSTINE